MAPVPRFSRWAVLYDDIVVLARAADHCAAKFLGVVTVDHAHFPPARPFGLHTDGSEPIFFGQHRVRNRDSRSEGAWLLQIDREAEHHTTAYIDDHGEEGALDRLTVLLIDHNHVHGRMVNLRDGSREVSAGEMALDGLVLGRRRPAAPALLQFEAVRELRDARADRIGMGPLLDLVLETLQWASVSTSFSRSIVGERHDVWRVPVFRVYVSAGSLDRTE